MQIRKTYSGTIERKLLPDKTEFAGTQGDNRSCKLVFIFDPIYEDYEKNILFDTTLSSPSGRYQAKYRLDENDEFEIPIEITASSRKPIGYNIILTEKNPIDDANPIIEVSQKSYVSFNESHKPILEEYDLSDFYSLIYKKTYAESRYGINESIDRPEIIFTSMTGVEHVLPLEMPFLSGGKIPRRFLDEQYIQDLFFITDDSELVDLEVQLGDFVLNTTTDDLFVLTAEEPGVIENWLKIYSPNPVFDNLDILGDLDVVGDTSIDKNLHVKGTSLLEGEVEVNSNLRVDENVDVGLGLVVDGDASVGSLEVLTDATINGDAFIKGDLDVDGSIETVINVTAQTDLVAGQDLKSGRDTEVGRNLDVVGDAEIHGDLQVDGSIDTVINVTAQTDLVAGQDLKSGRDTDVGRNLVVEGTSNLKGDVVVDSDVQIAGSVEVLTDAVVRGNASIKGDLDVDGSIDTVINVNAQTDLTAGQDLKSGRDTSVGRNLDVVGDAEVHGDLKVDGSINTVIDVNAQNDLTSVRDIKSGRNLEVIGTSEVNGNAQFNSDLSVDGDIYIGGIEADSEVGIFGDVGISKDLFVDGKGTIGSLEVDADALIKGNANVMGDLQVDGSINTVIDVLASRDLSSGRNTSVGKDLDVKGDVAIGDGITDSEVNIKGSLNVTNDVSVEGVLTTDSLDVLTSISTASDLDVGGNINVDGNATIGNGIVPSDLTIKGNSNTTGNATTIGKSTTGSLEVDADALIKGDARVNGDLQVDGSIDTVINVTAQTHLVAGQDLKAGRNLEVAGTTLLKGNVKADSDVQIDGDAIIGDGLDDSNLTIKGNLSTTKDSNTVGKTTTGSLEVDDDALVNGNARVMGDLQVDGSIDTVINVTAQTDLVAGRDLKAERNLEVKGDVSVGDGITDSDVNVFGNLNVSKNTAVVGKATLGSLEVTADTVIKGDTTIGTDFIDTNFVVKGDSLVTKDSVVEGKITAGTLDILGDALIKGNGRVMGDLKVDGSINTVIDVNAQNDLTSVRDIKSGRNLEVAEDVLVNGNEVILGTSEIGGDTYLRSDLLVDGNAVIGTDVLKSDFIVKGDIGLTDNIDVGGDIGTSILADRVIVTDADGVLIASAITKNEAESLIEIQGNVQEQINTKEAWGNKTSQWNTTPSDTRYPTEKLVKDTLDLKATVSNFNAHATNVSNPHAVTKAQVGLGNANNTSDANKPISSATQTALDGKVNKNDEITAGTSTKVTYDAKGLVTEGTILSATDIPVLDADKITTGVLNLARIPSLPASRVTSGAFADARIPTNIERNTNKVAAFQSIPTDVAYPTEKLVKDSLDLKADDTTLTAHKSDKGNPHAVTKAQVGLGNADNTSDINKPISSATQTALDTKVNKNNAITAGTFTKITYDAKGLVTGGVILSATDIPDLDTSKTTSGVFDLARIPSLPASRVTSGAFVDARIPTNIERNTNKVSVFQTTPTDVNYPTEKLVKDTLDLKATVIDFNNHTNNKLNPHSVTKAQVGLGNADNTSDANKPISSATQTALNLKAVDSTVLHKAGDEVITGIKTFENNINVGTNAKPRDVVVKGNITIEGNIVQNGTGYETHAETVLTANDKIVMREGAVSGLNIGESSGFVVELYDGQHDGELAIDNSGTIRVGDVGDTQPVLTRKEIGSMTDGGVLSWDNTNSRAETRVLTAGDIPVLDTAKISTGRFADARIPTNIERNTNKVVAFQSIPTDVAYPTEKLVKDSLDLKADGTSLVAHAGDKANPHTVTKAQVGLGNADNTSDTNKPISSATQTELNTKVEKNADITAGTSTKVTYDAKGLVTSGTILSATDIPELDASKTTSGAFDLARLPSLPASKVTSGAFEDARIPTNIERNTNKVVAFQTTPTDVAYPTEKLVKASLDQKTNESSFTAHTGNNLNPHAVTKTQVGLGNVDNTSDLNKPISSATQEALDIIVGGTALPTHIADKTNPHAVTQTQVGLSNVDNTSDINKPISSAAQTALNAKVAKNSDITAGTSTKITYDAKGLVTSGTTLSASDIPVLDASKVTSGAFAVARIPNLSTGIITSGTFDDARIPTNIERNTNRVSAFQTTPSDSKYPTEKLVKTSLDSKADGTVVSGHIDDKTNPHAVSKSQVGLGSVDNTSDASKPISSATQTALNDKVVKNANITAGTATKITYDAKGLVTVGASLVASDIPVLDTSKITSGIFDVARIPNLSTGAITSGTFADARIPTNIERNTNKVSVFQTTPNDTKYPTEKLVKTSLDLKADDSVVSSHISDKANPHAVSKSQVGLGSVDNTSDANKPISSVTQTALNDKVTKNNNITAGTSTKITYDVKGLVTAGASLIASDIPVLDAGKITTGTLADARIPNLAGTKITSGYINDARINTTIARTNQIPDISGKVDKVTGKELSTNDYTTDEKTKLSEIAIKANNYTHPTKHPASVITQDASNRFVSDAEKSTWNAKADTSVLSGHTGNTSNPHSVTKAQVGLGNVDNTSDINKPISTATQTALNLKADKTQVLTNVPANAIFTDTKYSHPANHSPSIISQDANNRFVTDAEKTAWNGKETPANAQVKATTALNDAKTYVDGKVKTDVPVGAVFTDTPTDISGKVDKVTGKELSTNDYTTNEKNKLSGIDAEANKYVHPTSHPASIITQSSTARFVTDTEKSTWNGKVNQSQVLTNVPANAVFTDTPTDISGKVDKITGMGLSTNDYTSVEKAKLGGLHTVATSGKYTDLSSLPTLGTASSKNTGTGSGNIPILDSGGKLDALIIPALAISETFIVATQSAMLGLTAETGDICIRTDLSNSFILSQSPSSTLANWKELLTPVSPVQSVAGKVGVVTLVRSDVGLGNVDNTTDATKPVSSAQQTALNLKADKTQVLTNVPANAIFTDTKYSHPANHSPSIISQDANNRFVTDAEKTAWNGKETPANAQVKATTALNDAKTYVDGKVKTDVPVGAVFTDTPTDISGKVDKVTGKELSTNDYTTNEKNKLSGIDAEANKYVHPTSHPASIITQSSTARFVTDTEKSTWNGKVNQSQVLTNVPANAVFTDTPTDISGKVDKITGMGLSTNDYTSVEKAKLGGLHTVATSGKYTDLSSLPTLGTASSKNTGTGSGNIPILDSGGKLDALIIPALAISETFIVATQSAMLGLTAETGDICIRTDLSNSFILSQSPSSTLANWKELLTPVSPVQSVAGKVGVVTLVRSDVGLGNVDNTTDATKPVSSAQQTALNLKADKTQVLTNVPANAIFTDTKYSHPANHSPSIISQDANNRFVTDAEKTAWNAKETPANAQTKATTALNDAKNYVDGKVLTDVPTGAIFTDTKYSHPSTHPPSIIAQTSSARFVTDTEKTAWNGKVDASRVLTDVPAGAKFTDTNTVTSISGKTGVIAKADIVALGIPAQDTIPANLTLTELVLGNYKLVYNAVYNSLDVEVVQ